MSQIPTMAKHCFLLSIFVFLALISRTPLVCDASESIDDTSKLYIVYMGSLPKEAEYSPTSHHMSILQQVIDEGDVTNHLVRSYKRSFNGFAAMLNDQQRQKFVGMKDVVSVFPSKTLHTQTTRSWDFIGFGESVKREQTIESDLVIGVIDTGIWSESKSFDDKGLGPIPKKWKGVCEGGANFTCNKKIIGARWYDSSHTGDSNARDFEGHGTHTASTAVGGVVKGASLYGLAKGTARGAVPSARIAVYKACHLVNGCVESDVLAAIDDAIADGVDVINLSLGGNEALDFLHDVIAIGGFHAMENGVVTVQAAGNAGPYTSSVSSVAPWLLSVAASTIDRKIIDKVILGNGMNLSGNCLNTFPSHGRKFPIALRNGQDCPISPHDCSCSDTNFVKGKIVLCRQIRGSYIAYKKGAIATLNNANKPVNDGDGSSVSYIPSVDLNPEDYFRIESYTNSTKYPTAEILKSGIISDQTAPKIAHFSSRGPNGLVPEILKPDISAPGVNILAAYSPLASLSGFPGDDRKPGFNILSGTSMACPHVAGIAAYVKSIHPDWSPAAIKSAIMTTARPLSMNLTYDLVGEYAYGSGNVNPLQAIDPGLVYDISKEDYVQWLCNYGYDADKIKRISGENSTTCNGASDQSLVKNINYPALVIPVESLKPFNVKINRTVTNVGLPNSSYKATVMPNSKLNISVEPQLLSFKSLNEKQSFVVTVVGAAKTSDTVLSSSLIWSDGTHSVRSPIIVQ